MQAYYFFLISDYQLICLVPEKVDNIVQNCKFKCRFPTYYTYFKIAFIPWLVVVTEFGHLEIG